jgi:HK97 family phage major capsid protein
MRRRPVAEGADKPESTLVFDSVSDPVRKVAHWLPVTEEMLEDAPALQGYLDARLRLGVRLAEEDQLLNDTVVPPDIVGILNRAALAAAVPRGADTNADAVLKQIAAIATANNLQPSGIVMHPTNWLTIQLQKLATGEYVAGNGGPFQRPERPMLWGIPVVVTSAITLNTALVGCFRDAAMIFRKGNLRVEATNAHDDYFIKNLVAIRAEERLALAVLRPAAFGVVTGLN